MWYGGPEAGPNFDKIVLHSSADCVFCFCAHIRRVRVLRAGRRFGIAWSPRGPHSGVLVVGAPATLLLGLALSRLLRGALLGCKNTRSAASVPKRRGAFMTRRAVIFAPGSRAQDRACRSRLPGLALFAFAAFLIVFLGAAFLGAVFLAAGLAAGLAAVRGMFVGLWSPDCCFLQRRRGAQTMKCERHLSGRTQT